MKTTFAAFAFFFLAASTTHADEKGWTTVQRGLYLSRAGDCVACHTADPAKPYAGNFSLGTPFGDIYTANLTPDLQTASARGQRMISTA